MKRKSAALYDPYLDTLGGGERHILSILKVLDEAGYEINIYWDQDLNDKFNERFGFRFINKINFLPNIFKSRDSLKKIIALKNTTLFFYITDGSYFFSSAKKNYIFCMVPNQKLYPHSVLDKLKTKNFDFIANSLFTKNWLSRWGVESELIYPFIDKKFFVSDIKKLQKDKIILSVGRFFGQLHSKQQLKLINWFNKMKQKDSLYKNFSLIIAGGLKEEDKSYFKELQSNIKQGQDISLLTNLPLQKLLDLYHKSLIYVHMTGFGVDDKKNPELVEHLGLTPLEAMAGGCITFCYDSGGPKELIKDQVNGFLFKSDDELEVKMGKVLTTPDLQSQIQKEAYKFVSQEFSYETFRQRVKNVIL